ncbi:lipopolysaccharide assembly protein LapB [Alkalihalobacillus sp. AL-G]|uniref:tetratricopeptide repeat protein n=1 Tax=Alkalihalobacillus sp. AL-G TaxID=2926399 RepID=UPI00272C5CBE|nr:hypothetical protein [Alkalihalobacillus sp. AL-G]WLD93097.1 hypothetical protein MOJ78_19210 [Alkalihalobacillus sp. AL-G]
MVEATLISRDLSTQLNKWYTYILENDVQNARKLKDKITDLIDSITTKDFPTYLHTKLIELSHYVLEKDSIKAGEVLQQLESHEELLFEKLGFYYYFFRGQYEFMEDNFESSLDNYMKAEKYLKYVEEQFEIAEYHYKLTAAYYFRRQTIFSLSHLAKAQELFDLSDKKNIVRSADSQMAYGLIYIDMKQYDLAEEKFHTAYMYSKQVEDQQLVNRVLHNLGFFYAEQRLSEAAIRYLKPIAMNEDYEHNIKALFLVCREYCRMGINNEGIHAFNRALSYLEKTENIEYKYKFQLLKVLYLDNTNIDNDLFNESISYFKQKQLWDSVEVYSKLIAQAYSKNSNLEQAVFYYEMAQAANHTIFEMEALK